MIPIKDYPGPRRSFPWVMLTILVANILAFLYELAYGASNDLNTLFLSAGVIPSEFTHGIIPPGPPFGNVWLTLITSMFLHGGFLHIASNMLYLFIFGDNVEDRLGHLGFFIFYFVCGIVAGLTHIVVNNLVGGSGADIPSIGASGAIAGVLSAYLVLFPHAQVRTLIFLGPFILVPRIAAAFLIVFWFITQFISGLTALSSTAQDAAGGVAVWAHIGGFIAGLILVRVIPRRERQPALSY